MAVSEERDEARDAEPKAPVRRVTGVGLSPAVEKMFGALVEEQAPARAQPASERAVDT